MLNTERSIAEEKRGGGERKSSVMLISSPLKYLKKFYQSVTIYRM